jgi:ParB-like chromosome segregation protein Spo0J
MGASLKETFKAESTFTGVNIPCADLTIVGLDCPAEEYPDLADPDRINLPINPDLVASIAEHGVREPIKVRRAKSDPKNRVFVVTGRQRVKHAREAQRLMKSEILIKCVIDDYDPLASLIIENEGFRQGDSLLAKARKAERLRAAGRTNEEISRVFAVGVPAVRAWFDMLQAGSETIGAVARGEITAKAASTIGTMAPKDQAAALATAKNTKGQAQAEQVRKLKKEQKENHSKGETKPAEAKETSAKMTAAQVKKFAYLTAATKEEPYGKGTENIELANAVLRAVLGEGPAALKGYDDVQKLFRKALKPE